MGGTVTELEVSAGALTGAMGAPAETPVAEVGTTAAAGSTEALGAADTTVAEAEESVLATEIVVTEAAAVVVVVDELAAETAVTEAAAEVVVVDELATDTGDEVTAAVVVVAELEALSVLKTTVRPSVEEATEALEAALVIEAALGLAAALAAGAPIAPPNPWTIDAMTWEASTPAGREYTLVDTTINELAVALPDELGGGVMVELAAVPVLVGTSGRLMMSVGRWGAWELAPASLNEEEAGELGKSMISVT